MKYLLWLLVLLLIWFFWKKKQRRAQVAPARDPESMALCHFCGVHFPASDGVEADGHAYCSTAHRQAAQAVDKP